MYLTSEKKTEIFGKYGKSAKDSGSAESQIALFMSDFDYTTKRYASADLIIH